MAPEPGFTVFGDRFVRFGRRIVRPMARAIWDLHVEGQSNVPRGAMVLAANHFSHLDPPITFVASGRAVNILAVDELYGQSWVFDTFTTWLGAIPMSRVRAPLGALKKALALLDEGGVVGIFPEGRRVKEWGEQEPKRGAAWLSLATGAPIVPMAITGSDVAYGLDQRPRRAPIRVWIGEPIDPHCYLDRIDPLGAIMRDWHEWMDARLGSRAG